MRVKAAALLAVALSGCAGLGGLLAPAPIGPVFEGLNGGPPVECREVPERECLDAATAVARISSVDPKDVLRVIVTCHSNRCTAAQGEARLEILLRDGTTRDAGTVNYIND